MQMQIAKVYQYQIDSRKVNKCASGLIFSENLNTKISTFYAILVILKDVYNALLK
jgi:hypothetical protein